MNCTTNHKLQHVNNLTAALYDAQVTARKAWEVYSDAVDLFHRGRMNRPALEALYQEASNADLQIEALYKESEAAKGEYLYSIGMLDNENECDCQPTDTVLCPACKRIVRVMYAELDA